MNFRKLLLNLCILYTIVLGIYGIYNALINHSIFLAIYILLIFIITLFLESVAKSRFDEYFKMKKEQDEYFRRIKDKEDDENDHT